MTSLFNEIGSNSTNHMENFVTQFNQFRSMFTGNPETQVKQLLQSGKMSQEQFNNFAQTANQLRRLIKQIRLSFVATKYN